ncbi:MAG TPA: hypothetical protein VFG22_11355 [Polyangiales bacterium]|nr:hypothetical protein [Polyangiales bacterium]
MVITILLTSTLLTMLGIAGVLRGAYDLSLAPLPEDVRELYTPDVEVTEAEVQLLEAQVTNPYRRPMAAANVVVSALVLIGSFMLSWRRRLAQWWIKQAVVAKLIWIVAYTVSLISHIKLSFVPLPIEQPGAALQEVMAGVVLVSTFSAALHLAAAYRATRPDIREFIETTAKP